MRSARLTLIALLMSAPFCSRPFSDGTLVDMSILMKIQADTAALDAALALTATGAADNRAYIFATTDTHDGDFASGFANGIAGADDFCANQKTTYHPNLAGASTDYAALIMDDGTNRRACTTANCGGGTAEHVDWVLSPNTEYHATDGSTLFTTDAAGVFVFGGGNLDRAFDTTGGLEWWTGRLANDWIADSFFNCTNWTIGVAGAPFTHTGYYGQSNVTTENSLSHLNDSCDGLRRLLCVRRL